MTEYDRYGPVVVGIDGSRAAIHAAQWAIDEAVDRNVPLCLVHVTRVDYLRDGLDQEIDLPTLAGIAGMPVAGFRRAFARTFNTTPYQYVLDQRIEKSKKLMSTTTMTMTEISAASGFSSPSHFATTFKQRVGVTPTAYRHGT